MSYVCFFLFSVWWLIKQEAGREKWGKNSVKIFLYTTFQRREKRESDFFSVPVIYFSCFWFSLFFSLCVWVCTIFSFFFGNAYIKNVLSLSSSMFFFSLFFCFAKIIHTYRKRPPNKMCFVNKWRNETLQIDIASNLYFLFSIFSNFLNFYVFIFFLLYCFRIWFALDTFF